MTLTTQQKEQLYDLTANILSSLKTEGIVRVTNEKIIIYKSLNEKDPQNQFISLFKMYADTYGIKYTENKRIFSMVVEDFKYFYLCNKLSSN